MEKVYRIKASANVKPEGERKFHRLIQTIAIDASVLSLSKAALQAFAEATLQARFGSKRVGEVRWVEIEQGVIFEENTYWQE